MTAILRAYDPARDRPAALLIYREVGWAEPGDDDGAVEWIEAHRGLVAELDGSAECLVTTAIGAMRYAGICDAELPVACITGVTTSLVARKRGLASRLTARALAQDAEAGALVAALGCFEQGYYNRLGFGIGPYEVWHGLDPSQLRVSPPRRAAVRLAASDWAEVHEARLARRRPHGGVNLPDPIFTKAEMGKDHKQFGLGFRDSTGRLTDAIWIKTESRDRGPYEVPWYFFRDLDGLRDLLGLVRALGDQVLQIKMAEPAGVQLQDLHAAPLRAFDATEKSKFAAHAHARAYEQYRILDLAGCLARTSLPCDDLRFNLRLIDPVAHYLDSDCGGRWRGIEGDYIVTLGRQSRAEPGAHSAVPTLQASVGAFTRLWLGVRPATGLSVTDELSGPPELLEALDRAVRLPPPRPDWDF